MNQYDNLANRQAHYETTGPEIWEQTEGKITHFVVATGTGGTITGTAQYLKEKNPAIKIWAIDVFGSLLKKYHETGEVDMNQVHPYITEGIGEDFVPANYDMSLIDRFEQVTDKDGAVMTRRISREEGIFVGYSSGTAMQGLVQLKSELKKDDLVVVVFCDHGSRYVGKIYNDQWMMERGFFEVKTFKDIVNTRNTKRLVTVEPKQTVAEAVELMRKYDIEHIPVVNGEGIMGAVSEGGLFQKLFSNDELKTETVENIMEASYPLVSYDTPVERLGSLITKGNGAVLAKDDSGNLHIVTKYDVIQSMAK
jgi:cystathionine beta-synthase